MIEIISESRCTACNRCVDVCPTQVFDVVPGGIPRIARQDQCQTCFMCELYCPVDALYVDPHADGPTGVGESAVEAAGLLGGYSASLGWRKGRALGTERDQMDRIFALGVY